MWHWTVLKSGRRIHTTTVAKDDLSLANTLLLFTLEAEEFLCPRSKIMVKKIFQATSGAVKTVLIPFNSKSITRLKKNCEAILCFQVTWLSEVQV